MMRTLAIVAACGLLGLGSVLVAAKPGSPSGPGVTNPQIAFVKASTGGRRQLIVANEDGSSATSIYTSTRMLRPEMGSDGNVYFWDGGRFNRIAVSGGSAQPLFDTNRTIPPPSDLSPDGTSLAWFSEESGGIFRYSIGTGQQQAIAVVSSLLDLSFDRTGANIIFNSPVSDVDYEFRIVPASGGTPASYGLVGRYSMFDASHLDATLVISVFPGGGATPYIGLWEPGMSAPMRIADGYQGTYRCDDSAIFFQRVVGSGSAIFRRSSSGAITTVAKPEAIFPSARQIC